MAHFGDYNRNKSYKTDHQTEPFFARHFFFEKEIRKKCGHKRRQIKHEHCFGDGQFGQTPEPDDIGKVNAKENDLQIKPNMFAFKVKVFMGIDVLICKQNHTSDGHPGADIKNRLAVGKYNLADKDRERKERIKYYY